MPIHRIEDDEATLTHAQFKRLADVYSPAIQWWSLLFWFVSTLLLCTAVMVQFDTVYSGEIRDRLAFPVVVFLAAAGLLMTAMNVRQLTFDHTGVQLVWLFGNTQHFMWDSVSHAPKFFWAGNGIGVVRLDGKLTCFCDSSGRNFDALHSMICIWEELKDRP